MSYNWKFVRTQKGEIEDFRGLIGISRD